MDENQAYLKALQEEVEKKAKRANQRLRQLEKSGITESARAYQVTVRKAYDNVPGYVVTAKGNVAFDRRLKDKTVAQLESELEDLDRFLEAHTSIVKGYKKQLEQSYTGFLKTTGMTGEEMSFTNYQQLFTSKATEHYGYDQIMAIQKETNKAMRDIDKALSGAIELEEKTGQRLGQKNLIERVLHPERFKKNGERKKTSRGEYMTAEWVERKKAEAKAKKQRKKERAKRARAKQREARKRR